MTDSTLHADALHGEDQESSQPSRKVSRLLWVGIALLPILFSWFTLRRGHSSRDRAIAFVWLLIVVIAKGAGPDRKSVEAEASEATAPQQISAPAQSPRDTIEEYARMIEGRGGICVGVANQLRMVNNNFGVGHPAIADTLGKAEQYGCL